MVARSLHQDAQLVGVMNDGLARHLDGEIRRTNRLGGAIAVKRRERKVLVNVILLDYCRIGRNSAGQLRDTGCDIVISRLTCAS